MKDKTLNIKLGKKVKLIRKHLKNTQIEFSNVLDLDQAAISRIENGKQALTAIEFLCVLRHFNMDMDEFFNFSDTSRAE